MNLKALTYGGEKRIKLIVFDMIKKNNIAVPNVIIHTGSKKNIKAFNGDEVYGFVSRYDDITASKKGKDILFNIKLLIKKCRLINLERELEQKMQDYNKEYKKTMKEYEDFKYKIMNNKER